LLSFEMQWSPDITRREPEKAIRLTGVDGEEVSFSRFFHAHEVHAIASIAWHAEKKRLWS
jgi:hypothetical protein